MKVGIITFHFVPNQGAVLQCCATKIFLEKNGHEAVVIDYRPKYHTVRYSKFKNPFLYARWFLKKNNDRRVLGRINLYLRCFVRAIVLSLTGKDNATLDEFNTFISKNLSLTERFFSYKQLKENPPVVDACICGSDQLWNPKLLDHELDKAYFLDFCDDKIPKVSYAVSIGETQNSGYYEKLKEYSKALTSVSLREYDADIVSAIGRDVHICIDPTLLLDDTDYEFLESKELVQSEPYIFVYGFENTDGLHEAIKVVKNKYKCIVINGSPNRIKIPNAKNLSNYGPDRFLTLIKNSECVVTNSFHGTAFSIVYKKDFITVAHSTRSIRMVELLVKLNLDYRLWSNIDFSFEKTIDWEAVYKKLQVLRQYSGDYLLESIQGIRGEDIPHGDEEII